MLRLIYEIFFHIFNIFQEVFEAMSMRSLMNFQLAFFNHPFFGHVGVFCLVISLEWGS